MAQPIPPSIAARRAMLYRALRVLEYGVAGAMTAIMVFGPIMAEAEDRELAQRLHGDRVQEECAKAQADRNRESQKIVAGFQATHQRRLAHIAAQKADRVHAQQ